jgi:hypothetical protein
MTAAREDRDATMKKTAIRQALIYGLVGPALLVAVIPSFAQVQSAVQERRIAHGVFEKMSIGSMAS